MGYSFDYAGRLACDGCGKTSADGVRVMRRRCPHKVLSDTLRCARRIAMDYCPAPALCGDCYRSHGGKKLHDVCAEPAKAAQAEYDAIEAALDAGEMFVIAAYGSWHDNVPAGKVGVLFSGRDGQTQRLVDEHAYGSRGKNPKLSDFDTEPWEV
ncbi:hypothetical protein SEA_NANOSMITE_167 [Mycobacterium phage Nanosmite]|nr:hypothetical protein SEA_NANOSMITE_167 [Mycobacterium phage Nanosmite]